MKKLAAFLFVVCMGAGSLSVQLAKTCFTNIPDSLSLLLTAVNRADFINSLESEMKAEITNRLGDESEATELASGYTCIQAAPRSSWQTKLLAVNDNTQLIRIVSTVYAPVYDSHINFYTIDWKGLPSTSYLPSVPDMDDFIAPASGTVDMYRYQDTLLQADTLLVKADPSNKGATLTFTFATPDCMEKEAVEKLEPFLRRPVSYVWREGKFAPIG